MRHRRGGDFVVTYRKIITGVSTVIFLVKQLCRLQTRFGAKIVAWAQDRMTPENYAIFRAWYDGISAVCLILESTPDD